MKSIKFIGPAHPFRGGLASFNERLAIEFQRRGITTSIDTFTVQYPNFLFPGKSQFTDTPPPANLQIARKINSVNPVNWVQQGLRLKKEKHDVLFSRFWLPFIGPSLGTINYLAKKNRHTKIIGLLDNVIPHEQRIGDQWLTHYYLNSVDGFIVMSQQVENDLRRFEPHKPSVLTPHPLFDNFGAGVDKKEACKHLQLNENKQYILFFGFIRPYKGLDLLLDAFEQIAASLPDTDLIIAGEFYAGKEKYINQIQQSDYRERIHLFSDFIPDNEVKYFFSAANLIVQPYKSATQSGITQIAYHFEKPMIVTGVGGLKEMVPHEKVGYVVLPNANDIAQAIHRFFIEKPDFSANIKHEKAKYSWETMVGEIERLYLML